MFFEKTIKSSLILILRLISKYFIAYQMFDYAFSKILKNQFHLGSVYEADYNISHYDGFMLTWYYYSYSRTYVLIIASCQIMAATLILFKKTERIGTILLLSFMINILLVNIFYKIGDGALQMSIILTLMGLFLLISDWNAFLGYFFNLKLKENNDAFKTKYIWSPVLTIIILGVINIKNINKIDNKTKLIGVWQAISPSQKFFKIYFDDFQFIKIKDFEEKSYIGVYDLNEKVKSFKFDLQYYSEIGYFKVQDSIKKLHLNNEEIELVQDNIINHFNKQTNVILLKNEFNYKINNDTLILIDKLKQKQYFLNITNQYPSLND